MIDYSKLKKEIPYKWKVQSFNGNKTKGSCVAYIDARDVMDLLDEVCSPNNWQDKYEFVGDKLIAGIGIRENESKDWVWKYDTGTESPTEQEKGLFSDAFKRAAVKWGIGRFLYDLEIKWVNIIDEKYPADENGVRIYNLTKYINSLNKELGSQNTPKTVPNPTNEVTFCTKHGIQMSRFETADGLHYYAHIGTQGTRCYGK